MAGERRVTRPRNYSFSFLAAIVIHEAGHAGVAVLLGFRVQEFAAWPLRIHRAGASRRIATRFSLKASGFVRVWSGDARDLRIRAIALILGGPLFSLVVAVIFFGVAHLADPGSSGEVPQILRSVAIWCVAGTLLNLLPVAAGEVKTDGWQIVQLLRGRTTFLRSVAAGALMSGSENRPREWDPALLSVALDGLDSGEAMDSKVRSVLLWLRYNWCADTGRVSDAGDAIESLISGGATKSDRWNAQWEAVWFEIFSNDNPAGGRRRLEIAEALPEKGGSALMIWKARAAVAAAEGRSEEARDAAARVVAELEKKPLESAGLEKAIRDDLTELLERFTKRTQDA